MGVTCHCSEQTIVVCYALQLEFIFSNTHRSGHINCACQKCNGQRNGLIWLGEGQVIDSCECGNEPPSSIKCGE